MYHDHPRFYRHGTSLAWSWSGRKLDVPSVPRPSGGELTSPSAWLTRPLNRRPKSSCGWPFSSGLLRIWPATASSRSASAFSKRQQDGSLRSRNDGTREQQEARLKELRADPRFQVPWAQNGPPVCFEGGASCDDIFLRIHEKEQKEKIRSNEQKLLRSDST